MPTLQTEMRTNGVATCTEYRIRTYVPEKVEGKKVKNDNNIEKRICKR